MFSSRTPRSLDPNRLSLAVERKRAAGEAILDLTESNPTRAGFEYPAGEILAALADPRGLDYAPDPRGLAEARDAISAYYAERGVAVGAERLVLTASTSEAYTLLFKLLAEPGDAVLVPVPSYPLFEHLARVEGVLPVAYPLVYDGTWRIDADHLEAAVDARTRAIVVVSPNNPTGSSLKRDELARLVGICARHRLALVCDEVFADFTYGPDPRRAASVAATSEVLTFTLSGLSKIAGLPQLKLGWVAVNGPVELLGEALARLEFLADLFLSVGTPVQCALARLLALAPPIRHQIRGRVAANREWLDARLGAESACRALAAEGGWYAIVRVPRIVPDEELALALVERESVLVQPGYFYDFDRDGLLVLSLITEPAVFREGVERLLRHVGESVDIERT